MTLKLLLAAFILILITPPIIAETQATRDIEIDGDSSDFLFDETLFSEAEELNFDSRWDNNEIEQIKVTWDEENLYIAVDGRIWGNNLLLLLDTDPFGGAQDLAKINAWKRKLYFFGRKPDAFFGTWDNNTVPQFWMRSAGAENTFDQIQSGFESVATFSQGRPGAAMEGALPWSLLYPNVADGVVPANAEIALVAVVVSKDDLRSGPDCAPNNSIGMPQSDGESAFLDNFAVLHIDRNADGHPDIAISPAGREGDALSSDPPLTFIRPPDAPQRNLVFQEKGITPRAFSPNADGALDVAVISFKLSSGAPVDIEIFGPLGRRVRTLAKELPVEEGISYEIEWDGRDHYGVVVEPGLYLATVVVGRSERIKLPVAVVR